MKNLVILLGVALVVLAGLFYFLSINNGEYSATSNEEQETQAELMEESVATMEPGVYAVETKDSLVSWQAGKPAISGYVHTGTFAVSGGKIELTDDSLSGDFTLDMNSLKVTSLGGGKAGQESMLEGHLKAEGFFDVANHPTATFVISDVSPKILPGPGNTDYTASGELTLKGRTNDISFPMKVIVGENNEVWMYASLTLDRTLWGVSAGSASIADRITENIIGDDVVIDIEMKLVK